jgi:hypothetical protein
VRVKDKVDSIIRVAGDTSEREDRFLEKADGLSIMGSIHVRRIFCSFRRAVSSTTWRH